MNNPRSVRPKKHLGQHFLLDDSISQRIVESLTGHGGYQHVLEIGPGTGALTQFLAQGSWFEVSCIEADSEAVEYLSTKYPGLSLIKGDFLNMGLTDLPPFHKGRAGVIGNFPYNISSQILFKVYGHRDLIPEVVGMFQKEVAERIATGPGSKTYGIISVLLQAFYDIEYLFTVPPEAFHPPPRVNSGVIRLQRNATTELGCDEKFFKTVVKTAFNQRRKTLRNALRPLLSDLDRIDPEILGKRAEQLSVTEFITLTSALQPR